MMRSMRSKFIYDRRIKANHGSLKRHRAGGGVFDEIGVPPSAVEKASLALFFARFFSGDHGNT